jgi:hypothetical protein
MLRVVEKVIAVLCWRKLARLILWDDQLKGQT